MKNKKVKQGVLIVDKRSSREKREFGGVHLKGKRKSKRPIATRKSMHVTLRSSYARGRFSFLRKQYYRKIDRIISQQSQAFGVKVYRKAARH